MLTGVRETPTKTDTGRYGRGRLYLHILNRGRWNFLCHHFYQTARLLFEAGAFRLYETSCHFGGVAARPNGQLSRKEHSLEINKRFNKYK